MYEELNKVIYLHIPKTGGAVMEYYFYNQTKQIRRNYFLSFFGVDDSRYIQDEHSTTGRPYGNHCVIETIFSNKPLQSSLFSSPHFKQSKLLFGHTVYDWSRILPKYTFEYVTVVRDPIDRVISNILQYTNISLKTGQTRLGKFITPEKNSPEYWDFVYRALSEHGGIPGLLPHENMNFKNCQTRVFEGQDLSVYKEDVNLETAKKNSQKINFSFFDDFNEGLQKSFDKLSIPIDMSRNEKPKAKEPIAAHHKKLMSLLIDWNRQDKELYEFLATNNTHE